MATYVYEQKKITFRQPFDNVPYVTVWWKNEKGDSLPSLLEPIVTRYGFTIPMFSNTTDDVNEIYSKFEWSATARTSTNRLTINTTPEDAEINVEFYNPEVIFTINPTPSDAVVTLTADGYIQEGNSITVEPGTEVNYRVESFGEPLYAWDYNGTTIYTKTLTPIVGENNGQLYDITGTPYAIDGNSGYIDVGSALYLWDSTITSVTEDSMTISGYIEPI